MLEILQPGFASKSPLILGCCGLFLIFAKPAGLLVTEPGFFLVLAFQIVKGVIAVHRPVVKVFVMPQYEPIL